MSVGLYICIHDPTCGIAALYDRILANGSGGFGLRSVGEKNPSVFLLGYPAGFGFFECFIIVVFFF